MEKDFNFKKMDSIPAVQSATETMVKAFEKGNGNGNVNGNAKAAPAVQSTSNSLPSSPSLRGRAGERLEGRGEASLPMEQGRGEVLSGDIMSCVEYLATRYSEIAAEHEKARFQAINLKTFPIYADRQMRDILDKYNDNRAPSTSRLTKSALAELLLIDAVHDLYIKICK